MKMKMRYFYLLVISSILSHFMLYTPSNLIKYAYSGALISIPIALAINIVNAYMIMEVYNKYKDNNLVEIHNIIFGKFIGGIFNLIYLILNIGISFFMFRGLIEIIVKYMLPSTPIWLISIIILILPYSNLSNNSRSYLRYISMLSVIMVIYTGIQLLLTIRNIHMDYIIGAFTHSTIKPNLICIAVAGFFFSGVSHLCIYNPVLPKLSWKKTSLLFLTFGILTAASTVLIPIGIWGPVTVKNVQLIWVATSDTLSLQLFLIERVLFVLFPLFFLVASSQILDYGFTSYSLIKILIPKRKIDLIIVNILGIVFVLLSVYISGTEKLLTYATITLSTGFFAYHILSLILFIGYKMKERRTCNEENN